MLGSAALPARRFASLRPCRTQNTQFRFSITNSIFFEVCRDLSFFLYSEGLSPLYIDSMFLIWWYPFLSVFYKKKKTVWNAHAISFSSWYLNVMAVRTERGRTTVSAVREEQKQVCVGFFADDWNLQVISSRIKREHGGWQSCWRRGRNSDGLRWSLHDHTPVCEAACLAKIIN